MRRQPFDDVILVIDEPYSSKRAGVGATGGRTNVTPRWTRLFGEAGCLSHFNEQPTENSKAG
jgi:hypothetical protein